MPDKIPEDISDRMPEDLPVTKRINVMVGITRSKVFFLPKLFHVPIFSCHTPACCNCKRLLWHKHFSIWPWMGFNWNMLRPQWEIIYKTGWSRKVAFESRKVAAGSGKVARSVFSFEGYKLPDSKSQFKGIPTSFPLLAGEIEITMPGPNWPQPKIKDMGN